MDSLTKRTTQDVFFCGKSFPETEGEITLGYLEGSHIQGEIYDQRMARRRACQAGMELGSFILVPRECHRRLAHKVKPFLSLSKP